MVVYSELGVSLFGKNSVLHLIWIRNKGVESSSVKEGVLLALSTPQRGDHWKMRRIYEPEDQMEVDFQDADLTL